MNRFRARLVSCVVVLSMSALALGQTSVVSAAKDHVGVVTDMTSSHIVVSGGLTEENLRLAEKEPRIRFQLAKRFQPSASRLSQLSSSTGHVGKYQGPLVPATVVVDGMTNSEPQRRNIDWSVSLGAGIIAPQQWPAKYGYNPNNPPDCVNDYVIFPLNVAGVTNGQANLLGINNLYSGSSIGGVAPPCGAAPNVNWAYNGSTAGGKLLTSATPSLDGTKVLYIESTAASSIFQVLTWKAGEGTSATNAAAPVQVGSCTASTSCLTSVTYSKTSTDKATFPWIDWSSDKVFVTSDNGTIYRLSCGFHCPLNTNPTVDWSFKLPVAGTGGSVAVPTGVNYDGYSGPGYLFVSDSLGEVWTILASGSTPSVAFGPVMIGGAGCTTTDPPGRTGTPTPCTANGKSYGLTEPVIDDVGTGMLYAFSGNDGTGAVAVQLNQSLAIQSRVYVGLGSVGNTATNVDLHSGTFDNTYFGGTPSGGRLFVCGTSASDTRPWQYWIGFSGYPLMDSTTVTPGIQQLATPGVPCTSLSEFYNPNLNLLNTMPPTADHDLIMYGLLGSGADGNLVTSDISFLAFPNNPQGIAFIKYPGGTSNFIVDNDGSLPQESSMYFTTQGVITQGSCVAARCAVN